MTRKVHRFTRPEQRAVEDLIADNKERIESGSVTKEDMRRKAGLVLGLKPTDHQIGSAAKAVGVTFPQRRGPNGYTMKSLHSLTKAFKVMSEELKEMAEVFGYESSEEFVQVYREYVTAQDNSDTE